MTSLSHRILQFRVKPHARKSILEPGTDGSWIAYLKSSPVDGQANAELLALVAAYWRVSKSSVSLKRGATSRLKWIQIELPE